jgi:hypothetical protein
MERATLYIAQMDKDEDPRRIAQKDAQGQPGKQKARIALRGYIVAH